LRWTLRVLAAMFVVSLGRWIYQLVKAFRAPRASPLVTSASPKEEIDPEDLDAWVHSMGANDDSNADHDDDR
jgi:hypothetical protein